MGPEGDDGAWELVVGTRRGQQGSGRGDGDQKGLIKTSERWWSTAGDRGDQKEMVGTRR